MGFGCLPRSGKLRRRWNALSLACIPRNVSPVYRICQTEHLSVSGGENYLTFLYIHVIDNACPRLVRYNYIPSITHPIFCILCRDIGLSRGKRFSCAFALPPPSPFQKRFLIAFRFNSRFRFDVVSTKPVRFLLLLLAKPDLYSVYSIFSFFLSSSFFLFLFRKRSPPFPEELREN